MFDTKKKTKYKFELPGKIFYTGYVLEEDELFIKVKTIRDEIKILKKESLIQSWEVQE